MNKTKDTVLKNLIINDEMLVNQLTQAMDSKLHKEIEYFCTYVYLNETAIKENTYPLRYPGQTVGHFSIDDERHITEIVIYPDTNVYTEEINEVLQEFIGWIFPIMIDKRKKTM